MTNLSEYLLYSKHRLYGAITALIMLVLYEIFLVLGPTTGRMIRNAPDAWFRTILYYAGISPHNMSFILITLAFIAIIVFYNDSFVWRTRIVLGMILESILLGILSGFLIQFIVSNLIMITGSIDNPQLVIANNPLPYLASGHITGSLLGDLGLAIGAGLFEELLFRVILTTLLILLCTTIFGKGKLSITISILIASLLFSWAHYIGSVGDTFELYSFLFRFFAGIWFTTIYAFRGFAIVSMTHAFYDIFVILSY